MKRKIRYKSSRPRKGVGCPKIFIHSIKIQQNVNKCAKKELN
jgi:hypothetical protein